MHCQNPTCFPNRVVRQGEVGEVDDDCLDGLYDARPYLVAVFDRLLSVQWRLMAAVETPSSFCCHALKLFVAAVGFFLLSEIIRNIL